MPLSTLQSDILTGRGGVWTRPARWTLASLAAGYEWAVARRNGRFASGAREIIRLPVPVISVGNITTGGTGKTPLVMDLARRLLSRGRVPAVLTRGYKSRRGAPGDEAAMIAAQTPGVLCVQNPDRIAGGRSAIDRGAEVLLLDDGFQHRRLGRDLDVVVVDVTNPFGFDRLLPLGRLREPVTALARADLIVMSRIDLVDESARLRVANRIAEAAPGVRCVTSRHRVVGLSELDGAVCDDRCVKAILMSAIGNPESFTRTVERMGIEVAARFEWSDHHPFSASDINRVVEATRRIQHDVVLTTRKDIY